MKFVSILEDGDKFDKLVKDARLLSVFPPNCGHFEDMRLTGILKDKLKGIITKISMLLSSCGYTAGNQKRLC